MRISKVTSRGVGTDAQGDFRDGDESQTLLLALKELVERLSAACEGGPSSEPREIEQWEGEGYLYLETTLPGALDLDIDVNIQAGRAFIRMAH